MSETCQNFILKCEPHQLQQGLALSDRKSVGTIHSLPVLHGTAIGVTSVSGLLDSIALFTGRIGDDRSRGFSRLRYLPTNVKSAVGINAKTDQETLGSACALEGLEVLGVDEVKRFEGKGGGVDVLVLGEIKLDCLFLLHPFLMVTNVRNGTDVSRRRRTESVNGGSGGGGGIL